MQLIEVKTARDAGEFILLPVKLYKNEPSWIRPLDKDIENVFDKDKNKTFRHGECIRWILKDDESTTIGRIAAFVDQKTMNKANDQPTGGVGFFECIKNQEAAFALFDKAKQWLKEKGMEAMDGPINFGSRDRWWGLLIEGFNLQPNYQCNYNFAYYKDFFEAYGFQPYFYQFTFGRPIAGPLDDRLYEKALIVSKDPNYRFSYVEKKDWKTLPEKIMYVFNKAWAKRGETAELTLAQASNLVKQMEPIMDEKLIWFGYYKEEPVVFFLSLPEVNQVFKHLNGNLYWWGKLKFVWYRWRKPTKKAFGILFGVIPEHQGKGVDGAIVEEFRKMAQAPGFAYDEYEMNWIGDFNPKMIRVVEQVTKQIVKKHVTFRKLFDETKPFKRMPIVN
jgi:GNAT superfamily N-acetyltransferase